VICHLDPPCGKWITETVQIDPMEFDMFQLDNINIYTCLQVHVSIEESIQLATTIGNSTIASLDLIFVVHEGEDDGVNNAEEYATSCDSDG